MMEELHRDASTIRVPSKRGRPRKEPTPKTTTRIINKIMETIDNHAGEPILYASTTKGTMKLVVDGHHFRYSFRKGKYTIFQCCYKENLEECPVRVVTDQKLVFPLDGEHIHFVQATDKSVTAIKFAPGSDEPEREFVTITNIENITSNQTDKEMPTISSVMGSANKDLEISPRISNPVTSPKIVQHQKQATISKGELTTRPMEANVKVENNPTQESEYNTELSTEKPVADNDVISSEEFREKIKKRLQKALLGKKK